MTPEDFAAMQLSRDQIIKAQIKLAQSHEDMRHDMGTMRIELHLNTEVTREVKDILQSAKGFFRGASLIGKFFAWVGVVVGAIVTVCGAIWAVMHGGKP